MARYIETPAYYDSMPVDISFAFGDEKPAGKHGFVRTEGEQLVFADGTPARFWGVCFNGGANFPSHDYAEKVANRLSQTGINLVRCHQLDAWWHSPNIFSFTRGKKVRTTRVLDPESMDRLDYLLHCLKQRGIYIYMDNIVLRKFTIEDGVEHAEELFDGAKPYGIFDEKLIESCICVRNDKIKLEIIVVELTYRILFVRKTEKTVENTSNKVNKSLAERLVKL